MREAGKQRGSLLIGLPIEEMRRITIRGGLVINAQLYEVRLSEKGYLRIQYFNYQQWGHT